MLDLLAQLSPRTMDGRSCGGIPSNSYRNCIDKMMISAYFTRQGFVSVEALPETERFNYIFFIDTILPNIVQSVNVFRPNMQVQGDWMQIDNAQSHNSALSFQKTEELRFTRLAHPHYSPDLALCDFFLFGYLKKEPCEELQVPKWGDLCGESNFDQNPHSNALTSLRRMDREITRVYCE
jgi:hypothetical protein